MEFGLSEGIIEVCLNGAAPTVFAKLIPTRRGKRTSSWKTWRRVVACKTLIVLPCSRRPASFSCRPTKHNKFRRLRGIKHCPQILIWHLSFRSSELPHIPHVSIQQYPHISRTIAIAHPRTAELIVFERNRSWKPQDNLRLLSKFGGSCQLESREETTN
jgi:hypothetical protein